MRLCMMWVLLCLVPVRLAAAGSAESAPAWEGHRLQRGDVLDVHLWHEGEEARSLTVDTAGCISCPVVGILSVRGLTVDQVTQRIIDELRQRYVRQPRVTVALQSVKTPTSVYVIGSVNRPGPYEVVDGMRVTEVLGLAGGLAAGADAARATLNSRRWGPVLLDLERLLHGDGGTQNPLLDAGDTLIVPQRGSRGRVSILVVGQVNHPGATELTDGTRLSDAVTAAGGAAPAAALKKATLARAGQCIPVDLHAALRQSDRDADLLLQEGDVLLIPEAQNRITLLGEFARPGSYTFREGDMITHAVSLAGGPTPDADLEMAVLRRAGTQSRVDLKSLLVDGIPDGNMLLEDGDTLFVPPGVRILTYGGLRRPGPVAVKRGMKLVDVLVGAGGLADRARPEKAVVVRTAGGEPRILPLEVRDAVRKGGPANQFAFEKGDVLYIPEKGKPFDWGMAVNALWVLKASGIIN